MVQKVKQLPLGRLYLNGMERNVEPLEGGKYHHIMGGGLVRDGKVPILNGGGNQQVLFESSFDLEEICPRKPLTILTNKMSNGRTKQSSHSTAGALKNVTCNC